LRCDLLNPLTAWLRHACPVSPGLQAVG
jgi:hypothetical protein